MSSDSIDLKGFMNSGKNNDHTCHIRDKKHSKQLFEGVGELLSLNEQYNTHPNVIDKTEFDNMCKTNCWFLYRYYTDIFMKVKNKEIDIMTLYKFIKVLEMIEQEKIDQFQGEHLVAEIAKTLYLDSCERKSKNLENSVKVEENPQIEPVNNISWKCYKELNTSK